MTIAKADLTDTIKEVLVRRARYAYPLEACGFIMNSADPDSDLLVYQVPNIAKDPRHSFLMEPGYQHLAYLDEENILGMWHSHPQGPDGPSATDLKFMPPGLRCYVVTRNGVFEYGMESA